MIKAIKLLLLFILLLAGQSSHAQSNAEQALAKAQAAVKLEDEEGKYDEALKLLQEAQKLDPDNIDYPYEIAYTYAIQKEYKKASGILEKLLKHKDVSGRIYQALGNAYDYQGKPEKAIETYEKGLKLFPTAGELYVEMGNMKIVKKDYNAAINYYEKGIENDPAFPSNYYWAAKLFCNSDEEVWGMLYGEIFINMERNSKRTLEISKLLFDTYTSEIKITSDTSYSISFSKRMTIDVSDLKNPKNIKLPFGIGFYEPAISIAVVSEKSIDIHSLDRIRTRFLERYIGTEAAKSYPNVLFDYQQQIKTAGHFEAYNHWLLLAGDEAGFESWQKANQTKWDDFTNWYGEHKMQVDAEHKFYRGQY